MAFGLFFIVPLAIALFAFVFSNKKITLKELGVQLFAQLIIAGSISMIIYHSNTSDIEIHHSQVINKARKEVSCEHSYRCHCYTSCSGSGKNRSCSEHCSTCYEHSYDVDWIVYSETEYSRISRIDRRGLDEPPRFTKVKMGEPYASEHSYENYIKGSPDTLFRRQGLVKKFQSKLPEYFGKIYDYYRTNRVINLSGVAVPDLNSIVGELNKTVGPQKQGSVGIVIVAQPREYFYALEEYWLGGKKNDIIPVIGLNPDGSIQWVEVLAWVTDPLFKIKLRDDLLALGHLNDPTKISEIIEHNTLEYYKRKPMKDFEYLKSSIKPTTTQFIIGLLISIICSIGISFLLFKEDLFNEENVTRNFYR